MFDFFKVCVFSKVNGMVTFEGRAQTNVSIIRKVTFNNEEYTDVTGTDEKGCFYFSPKYITTFKKLFPFEPVIKQKILIRHDEKEYVAWETIKSDYEEGSELGSPGSPGGKTIDIDCELTSGFTRKETDFGIIHGICDLRNHQKYSWKTDRVRND